MVKAPPPGKRPLKTLERVLSKAGAGSRSEARSWIHARRVSVNGRVVENPDAWVDLERDRVELDGKPLQRSEPLYLLLHKPAGYITTYRDPAGRPTIYELLPDRDRYLFPVGRLDLDTSGLLILTNDTQFAERLTNPDYHVPKTYRVTTSKVLADDDLDALRNGLELRDGPTRPAEVTRVRGHVFEITITEGRTPSCARPARQRGCRRAARTSASAAPVCTGESRDIVKNIQTLDAVANTPAPMTKTANAKI